MGLVESKERGSKSLFSGLRAVALGVLLVGSVMMGQGTGVPAVAAPQAAPAAPVDPNTVLPAAVPQDGTSTASVSAITNTLPALSDSIWSQGGKRVTDVRFKGVTFAPGDQIRGQLQQKAGEVLDPAKVRADLRLLFASGRYRDINVSGEVEGGGVALVYAGTARYYVGRVEIVGVQQERLASLMEFATKLEPGAPYTETLIPAAVESVKESLAENGYFEPVVAVKTTMDDAGEQVNATFTINTGVQSRVGKVIVEGTDTGVTVVDFRKKSGLNCGRIANKLIKNCSPKVGRETVSTALTGVRTYYQKKDRLEGTISLQKQTYAPERKQLDFDFQANQGPIVKVVINGVKLSKSRVKLLVPIYEEGAVDIDLLNEGAFNIREYLQQQGYFDITDSVKLLGGGPVAGGGTGAETIEYDVSTGDKHKVLAVKIVGNKYFDHDTLEERLRVKKADAYQRAGSYSSQLVSADVDSILALYRANGFNGAKVTSAVRDTDNDAKGQKLKVAQIVVTFTIVEGPQQKFGNVDYTGVDASRDETVHDLLSSQKGQPFSLITLSSDRDAVLGYYVSHGFDHAKVEFQQVPQKDDPTRTDVTLLITEGQEVFIDRVLLSGIVHTKQGVVQEQLLVHAGDPLDQAALLQTQRNLYNLALFNEVNAAVQNPTGNAPAKNVLVQLTEARRWDVTYGFGFEAQTGTPSVGPGLTKGSTAAQNGQAGVSPRVSLDISRINLGGTTKSITLHTTYGLLETVATLSLNNPTLLGHQNLTGTLSGGYSNVQNITTFQASTLQGDFRVTQKYKKADTFIYDYQYRRVSVNQSSLEITPNLVAQFSQPVTVGGPGITYFHDTRDPSPLDAGRGMFFQVQEFISDAAFGAATNFNRTDISESSYYTFGKKKYVFARNTRVGFENAFGKSNGQQETLGIVNCQGTLATTNASCNPIPLPERLYAGGATSHRGFGINDAGPRDLTTGYPVGGSAAVVNTFELRLPPPTLPYVGDSVSFVVFHDMGNVFQYPGDMFKSAKNFKQPNQDSCKNVTVPVGTSVEDATGTCSFNYYSHAVGLGARYKTPVGPIRLDFSYNLNPPIYPVFDDYTGVAPYVGKAGHFNFFFSIGQAF